MAYDSTQRDYGVNTAQAAPDTQSRIRDSVGQNEQFLSDLHGLVDTLEKRLDTVLMPTPATPGPGMPGKAPTPVASHLLGRLTILNEGYSHLASRIADITRRIEV